MIGEYDKNEILKEFPNIELSYELLNHNKVYDAEFILAIPEGKNILRGSPVSKCKMYAFFWK